MGKSVGQYFSKVMQSRNVGARTQSGLHWTPKQCSAVLPCWERGIPFLCNLDQANQTTFPASCYE